MLLLAYHFNLICQNTFDLYQNLSFPSFLFTAPENAITVCRNSLEHMMEELVYK